MWGLKENKMEMWVNKMVMLGCNKNDKFNDE